MALFAFAPADPRFDADRLSAPRFRAVELDGDWPACVAISTPDDLAEAGWLGLGRATADASGNRDDDLR